MCLHSTSEEWLIQRQTERESRLRGSFTRAMKQSELFKGSTMKLSLYTNIITKQKSTLHSFIFQSAKSFPTEWHDHFQKESQTGRPKKEEREGNDRGGNGNRIGKNSQALGSGKQEGRLKEGLSEMWCFMSFFSFTKKKHNRIPIWGKNGNFKKHFIPLEKCFS